MFTIHVMNQGERWQASVGELPGTSADAGQPLDALARSYRLATESLDEASLGATRREMLLTSLAAAFLSAIAGCARPQAALDRRKPAASTRAITLEVNGRAYPIDVDPRSTLLDALRDHVGLTGTKKGCDRGECGACTVHIDGKRACSCLTLAVMHEGRSITTIEGLAREGELHPVQAAFIDQDAFQCGYCTSGQIMSAVACIAEGHAGSPREVREWMSGNLCRCSAYPNIVAAVMAASGEVK
jgi:xanthine dehydrogenase YagT iron-sulfur-binding subunit